MKMEQHMDLSTDEQVWVVLRVRQGLMTMEDALEYVRKQHEHADEPPGTESGGNTVRSIRSNSETRKHNTLKPLSSSSNEEKPFLQSGKRSQSQSQLPLAANRNRFNSLFKPFVKQKSADDIKVNRTENGRPRSVFASVSSEPRLDKKAELLDLMVAQGKITKEDRLDLLKKYGTAENYRAGDTQRKILAYLVKTNKISIDDAVHYSRLLGIVGSAETEARTIAEINNAFQEKRIYNFGVYKYYRHRASQRRILQIDFQSNQVCNIQKGNLNRKFAFSSVTDYESEEGLKFFIYFQDHHEYELEADTLEEKEKICRLLQLIIENNKSKDGKHVVSCNDIYGQVSQCQKVIQEGFLEKKNHSLYTTWTRRWVRIRKGELSYYKPDDENQQALNILQLSREINIIKKMGNNGFSIATRKKVYQFRIISSGSKAADVEIQRDEWFKAVQYACGYHRESISGYNDDVFTKDTPTSPTNGTGFQSYHHNITLALKSFYSEIDKLQSMMGINEFKEDSQRTVAALRQIVQGLEGFILETPPILENGRLSCTSLSSNNESLSDQSSLKSSMDRSRLSLGLRHSWSQETTENNRNHDSQKISTDSLFKRSSLIEGHLEPVIEMNNENAITPVDEEGNELPGMKSKISSEPLDEPPTIPGIATPGGAPPPPPPPPPPPSLMPQVKRVFKVQSKVKMKAFHWNKVPNNHYNQSVWKTARDLTEVIDTEQLEMHYSDVVTKEVAEPEVNKTKLKTILDPKVAQNLGIFLAGFKMDVEEVKHRLTILHESEGGLSPEHIADLRKYHPNAEDIEAYKQFKDNPHELASTDQFMLHFCEIPNLKTRLDLLFFAGELPVKFEDLAPTIDNALEGCKALNYNQKFLSVLEYVLAIGNFINSGSSKGTAVGFRLSSLPKLSDSKGKDKKFTLLKYLVQQIHKHDIDLLDFTEELLPITLVPEASVKALQAEVEVMKKDLMLVRRNANVLLSAETPPERDIIFCDDVESFAEQFDLKLSDVQSKTDEMKELYDNLLVRFGEPMATESGEVFSAVSEFVKAFKREADLILVTARGLQTRKSKRTASRQPSCKSSARDSAVESYTSLDQSDSAGSDLEQLDENMEHTNGNVGGSSIRKSLILDKRRLGGSKRRREIKNTSKRLATYKRLPDNPTKEGYLEKLSNAKNPLSSQWNRRYFELNAQGYLYYSKRKNEKNVESIYLRGCPVHLEGDRVIVLETEERTYKLRASDKEEAKDWQECLLVYSLKRAHLPSRKYSEPASFGLPYNR